MLLNFYHYCLHRMETRPDQKAAIQSCRDLALRMFDDGPITWAVTSGAELVAALYDINAKPGMDLLPVYGEIEEALLVKLQEMRLAMEAERELAIHRTGCGWPGRKKRGREE